MLTEARCSYDVDIAQLVEPEVVRCASRVHEVALVQLLVDLLGRKVQLVQDPLLNQALVAGGLMSLVNTRKKETRTTKRTLGVGSGTNFSSSLSIANLVALEILLQNLR